VLEENRDEALEAAVDGAVENDRPVLALSSPT
jgi:hypothetical protein